VPREGDRPEGGTPAKARKPAKTQKTGKRRKSVPGMRGVYVKRNRITGTEVYYGDFREYADVGGRCESLRPEGARRATTDPAEALACYAARKAYYEARRAGAPELAAPAEPPHLGPALADHLEQKAAAKRSPGTLARMETAAHRLLDHFGNVPLAAITTKHVARYVRQREQAPGTRDGTTTSNATIRIELSLLSGTFKRAIANEEVVRNPVEHLQEPPAAPPAREVWLTREEAARLLDAGAEHDVLARRDSRTAAAWSLDAGDPAWQDTDTTPRKQGRTVQWEKRRDDAEALLATLLYSGGRIGEVLGLLVGDVDFAADTLTVQQNDLRGLKRAWHKRTIQLWPPLATTLGRHVARLGLRPTDPLFPTELGAATPVTRIDKLLARCCRRAGLDARRISPHALRHTFATMLLRTFVRTADGGMAQRSAFDVAKALGHCSSHLVDKVYGHQATEDLTESLTYEVERRHPISALQH
jgi:integrase